MKGNWIKTICLSFLIWALVISPLMAISINDIPNPRKLNGTWVSDVANILSADTESQINQRISQLEARNGTEIAVVTVPDTAPANSVKSYTTELFNTWGIGKRGIDNGVLFLIAVKERRIEIETGRGITPHISNDQVVQIIETKIKPEFKLQNFDQGAINGVEELANRLEVVSFIPIKDQSSFNILVYQLIGISGIAIAIGGIIWTVLKINKWCEQLPNTSKSLQSPLVFQLEAPKIYAVAKQPLLLIALGIGAIAVSVCALLVNDSSTSLSLMDRKFSDLIFRDVLPINFVIPLVSLPMWFGLAYYWSTKLSKVLQRERPSLWIRFFKTLGKNLLLLLMLEIYLSVAVAILTLLSVNSIFVRHLLFVIIILIIAISYQLFLIYVINNLAAYDEKNVKDRYFCATCRTPTQRLDEALFKKYLTKPEQQAVALGNATYALYSCDRCHPLTSQRTSQNGKGDRQHIYCHPHILKEESICPKCKYPTAIATDLKQSRKPKKFPKQGSKEAISIWQCQNCFHEQPVYPYVASTRNYFSDHSSDYSSSSSSSDSSDYGSSSSSSSDFGGGGSDGGGGGSDW